MNLFLCDKIFSQSYVVIPDTHFVQYLDSLIPSAMNGNQLDTVNVLVTTTTYLDISNKNIADLNGIQYFKSLGTLKCQHNNLTGISLLNNSLNYLDCSYNSINNISSLPDSLNYLDCSNNSLVNLPTLDNNLQTLKCEENQLSALPTLPNALVYVLCWNNQLTNLPPLKNLNTLECGYNNLSYLPTLPNTLIFLNCEHNHLTSIPQLPQLLQTLVCNNNSITTLLALDSSLTWLYCNNNSIECFPVFPKTLTDSAYFSIKNNPFTCLPNYVGAMAHDTIAYPICTMGNSNGCAIEGIEKYGNYNDVSIFPDPTSSTINIQSINPLGTITIYNTVGQLIMQQTTKEKNIEINLSNQSSGFYLIKSNNSYIRVIKQ